jgi:proteic killer suppression protein
MILSFSDKTTEALFTSGKHRRVPDRVAVRARQQLDLLDAAVQLEDLYFPPSNRFERLAGTNPRRYSIRVTRQYRVTFEWNGKDAENVRFEDYH